MGYKSVYKSPEIQARLEQGYYDDIVEAGIQGGVFDADTQPTKGELDLQLAKMGAGMDNCHLATIRITGIDSLSTRDDYEAFYQSVYEQLVDFRSTQKEILLDCDNLQAVARMNGSPLTEIPFVIEKAEINGSFHDSAALPIIKLHIYPLQKPDSSYCEAFVSLRMDSLENQGYTYSDSLTIVEINPFSSDKIIYPEIVGYNWSNDGGDSSLTKKDVTIEEVIAKLADKRQEIADLLEQNEVGLVYVKYGSSHLGTEERPEVYFRVEKTYSRSYTMTGYILRMTVMSPKFENDLEPSVAYIFEDGTYHIWKKENGVTYPQIASFNWGSVSGDGTLLGSWTVDEFASKLSEQYNTILEALSYTTGGVGLVSVAWGEPMSHFITYVKVEKSMSETYMNSRNTFVATPLIGTNISSLACKIYVSGEHEYVIWKKEDGVTYPHLGTYYSDNGGEKDLDELKSTFETLTRTLFSKIPKNGTAIFDLSVSGMGTLIIKAENVIRQMGTSWERGMYYTVMGGTGGFDFDFENYMGLVWVEVGGGTGGNANAVIWKKNNKMIYPELNSISWNHYGNPDIQTLANFLEDNFLTIENGIDEGGVALLRIINFSGSSTLLCKVEKSWRWIGTTATLGGLYITPLDVDLLGDTPCVIFLNSGSIPVIWKKEETSQTDPITLAMNMAEHLSSPGSGSGVLAGTDEEVSQMFLSLKDNPQTSIVITDGNTRITPMLQEFKDSGDTYYLDLIFIAQSNDYKVAGDGGDLEFTQKNLYKCYMKIKYEISTKNFTVDILNTIEIN